MSTNNSDASKEQVSAIEQFVDSYWPIPAHFISEEYGKKESTQHQKYLVEKYGPDLIRGYHNRGRSLDDWTEEKYQELFRYVYSTGLYKDVHIETTLLSRVTLGLVLEHLVNNQPRVIADMGTGGGDIAIGLGLYLDNTRVYAVDINKEAIIRLKKNIEELPDLQREKAKQNIIAINGSFKDPGIKKIISAAQPDIEIFAYPLSPDTYIETVHDTLPKNGAAWTLYNQMGTGLLEMNSTVSALVHHHNAAGNSLGLRFKWRDDRFFMPGKYTVLCEGRFEDSEK